MFEQKFLRTSPEGFKEMTDEKQSDTVLLIRRDNEKCREQVYETELEQNKGKCPYCGKTITKPERLLKSDL
jgi:acetyl-CoA carboxylase beta subunit